MVWLDLAIAVSRPDYRSRAAHDRVGPPYHSGPLRPPRCCISTTARSQVAGGRSCSAFRIGARTGEPGCSVPSSGPRSCCLSSCCQPSALPLRPASHRPATSWPLRRLRTGRSTRRSPNRHRIRPRPRSRRRRRRSLPDQRRPDLPWRPSRRRSLHRHRPRSRLHRPSLPRRWGRRPSHLPRPIGRHHRARPRPLRLMPPVVPQEHPAGSAESGRVVTRRPRRRRTRSGRTRLSAPALDPPLPRARRRKATATVELTESSGSAPWPPTQGPAESPAMALLHPEPGA